VATPAARLVLGATGALVIALPVLLAGDPARVPVSDFAGEGTDGWEVQSFSGLTRYTTVRLEGRPALEANSQAAASGLVRRIEVDLTRTPYLNWSWRVEEPLRGLEERSRSGDDYAARVYVIQSGGALFWRTRAVNYVWSGSQPSGTDWPNAFTDRARMVAVRSADAPLAAWQSERRNVRDDFRRLFGVDAERIHAVAIMTDTDNSGRAARAHYGEIYFSAR
jgi:hypothetical protein